MYDQRTVAAVLAALEEAGGNVTAVARSTGVSRATVSNWAAGRVPHAPAPKRGGVQPRRSFDTRAEAVLLVLSGATLEEAAGRVGACRSAVYNWVRKHREGGWSAVAEGTPGRGPAMEDRPEVAREHAYDGFEGTLEEKVRQLEVENAILREVNELLKGARPGEMSNREKAALIDSLRAKTDIPLRELTGFLRISKSSYEYQRRAIARGDKYSRLRELVREAFEGPGASCRGYRFVTRALRELPEPVGVSEKVVRRIMREEGLVPTWMRRGRKAWSSYAGEPEPAPENLVKRDFHSALPNFLWLTDITEFKVPGAGRCYLSAIRDCFDSSIVAWRIGAHPTADLANATLADACAQLAPGEAPVIHSDRGGHYRWPGWVEICEENRLVRSMSAKGCSPDNAAMEGFFGLLKREFFHGRDWRGCAMPAFMDALDAWIVGYNRDRRCGALGGATPLEFRRTLGRAA